jgi:hypothetical protein
MQEFSVNDTVYDPWSFERHEGSEDLRDFDGCIDAITSVVDMDAARSFVAQALRGATEAELDTIASIWSGISVGKRRRTQTPTVLFQGRPVQTAGGDCHPLFLRLMAYADALHDFDPSPPVNKLVVSEARVFEALKPELPVPAEDRDAFRQLCRDKFAFIAFLRDTPELVFPGRDDPVPNPLHGLDVAQHFDLSDHFELKDVQMYSGHVSTRNCLKAGVAQKAYDDLVAAQDWNAYDQQDAFMFPLELWLPHMGGQQMLLATQVVGFCQQMRSRFGSDAVLLLDNSDVSLLRIMMSVRNIDQAFLERYSVYPQTDFEAIVGRECAGVAWRIKKCDANMMDTLDPTSRIGPTDVLTDATGDVFLGDPDVQVTLGGITVPDMKYHYTVSGVANSHECGVPATTCYSAAQKCNKAAAKGNFDKVRKELALKLSGDWGQVQHCVMRNRQPGPTTVFVSSDALACSYAVSRDVPVVNLHHAMFYAADGKKPLFCRTCAVMTVRTARTEAASGGGSSRWTNVLVSIAACAVLAACAMFGRY